MRMFISRTGSCGIPLLLARSQRGSLFRDVASRDERRFVDERNLTRLLPGALKRQVLDTRLLTDRNAIALVEFYFFTSD